MKRRLLLLMFTLLLPTLCSAKEITCQPTYNCWWQQTITCTDYFVSDTTCYYSPYCSCQQDELSGNYFWTCGWFTCSAASKCVGNTCMYGHCSSSGCYWSGTHYGGCGTSCSPYCGDERCQDTWEDATNCPEDCLGALPVCGNGDCEPGEDSSNCCTDCGCPGGQVCVNNVCQSPPPPGEGNNPKGWHDFSDCRASEGWACDPDDYSQPLEIHFYADGPAGSGTFIGSTTANKESVRELENG